MVGNTVVDTIVLISNTFSCDTGGKCLALASSNNEILIVSGKPSEDFKVLGHTSKENGIRQKHTLNLPQLQQDMHKAFLYKWRPPSSQCVLQYLRQVMVTSTSS